MSKVLIVDDEEADRLLIRTILDSAGHELIFASNGEEALRLYLRESVDVVVTDIHMPRGDGVELISALRGLDPEARIIAISGQRPHRLQIAQLAGAMAILEKPIDRDRLIDAVIEVSTATPGEPIDHSTRPTDQDA